MTILGNWKMNLAPGAAAELAAALRQALPEQPTVAVGVCPPALSIAAVVDELSGSTIRIGAQNMHHAEAGAYTGEVSAEMVRESGCTYVLLGHSERRQYAGETDAGVAEKVKTALRHRLRPVVCVGETESERDAGTQNEVVGFQVKAALEGVSEADLATVLVAYEPVWAIGTGKTATPEQAQEMHAYIRGVIAELYDYDFAQQVDLLYGGSMNAENAASLLGQPDVDGGLIGGASLKAAAFATIVAAAEASPR